MITSLVLSAFFYTAIIVPVIIVACEIKGIISFIITPSFDYTLLFMCIYVLQFVFAGLAINERFKMLNKYLRISFGYHTGKALQQEIANLNMFGKAYQDLCDGIELINNTFTFHLIPVMINAIIIKTVTSYGILWEYVTHSEALLFIVLQNGAWLTMQFGFQILIAYVGSSVTKNAKLTLVTIARVLNDYELSEKTATQLQNLIARINVRNLNLQNEFFIINWKLLVYVRNVKIAPTTFL